MSAIETAVARPLNLTPEQRQDYLTTATPIAQKARKAHRIQKFAQTDPTTLADELSIRQRMIKKERGSDQDRTRAVEEIDCINLAIRGQQKPGYLEGIRQGYAHNLNTLQEIVATTHHVSAENQVKAEAETARQELVEPQSHAIDRSQYIAEMRPLANRLRDTRRFLAVFRETRNRLETELFNLQQTLRETPGLTKAQEDNYIRRIGLVQHGLRANQAQTPAEDVEVERKLLNEIKARASTANMAKKVTQGEVKH